MITSTNNNLSFEGDAYSNFANSLKSKETLWIYRYGLAKFMRYLQITDIDNLMVLASDAKALQRKIVDYILYMRDCNLKAASIETYLASVMHFYCMNDVTLNRKRIGAFIPESESEQGQEDRAYTVQEIARILQYCDTRNKAIVLLFASTGMRIGAMPRLRLEHLTKIDKYKLYKVKVYAGSKAHQYITFCTPECTTAIDQYLDFRERCGEKLEQKSPLFRPQFDINDLGEVRKPRPLAKNSLIKTLAYTLHRSGVAPIETLKEGQRPTDKKKPVKKSHGFRKFVITTMINAKINDTIREMLVDHSIELDKNYYRPQEDDLLGEYLKVVDMLTINDENRLRREVQTLKIQKSQLERMEDELSRLASEVYRLGGNLNP